MPKVSIGLPVYNGEKYIREAIDSILGQSFADFELIITDNASTDSTEEICRAYAAQDSRIRYYRNETNLGAAGNFNLTFSLSHGRYFKWAAYDDVLHRDFLATCVAVLETDPSVVLCFTKTLGIGTSQTGYEYEYDNKLKFDSPRAHRRLRNLIDMRHLCIAVFGLFRSDFLGKTQLIGNYVASDQCLLAETGLFGRIYRVPESFFFHRIHPESSCTVHKDPQQRWIWFDPKKAQKLSMANWRIGAEYIKSVRKTPLGLLERALCYIHIALWYGNRAGFLYREVRTAVRFHLQKTRLGYKLDPLLFYDLSGNLRSFLRRSRFGRHIEKCLFPNFRLIIRDVLVKSHAGRELLRRRREFQMKM
jgi:glycosyltransferase involved in cell wall biosynthesis